MRTIYYSITQELRDYNHGKHDKGTDAAITLLYKQDDWNFNESVWDMNKKAIKKYLKKHGADDIEKPIDIPV